MSHTAGDKSESRSGETGETSPVAGEASPAAETLERGVTQRRDESRRRGESRSGETNPAGTV
jgi:hypothetical protein